MARSWREILHPNFLVRSINKQGVLKSVEIGLSLIFSRFYHYFFHSKVGRAISIFLPNVNMEGALLYAFYDLEKSASGFDIVQFLVMADMERVKQKLVGMHVVIVAPKPKKFNRNHQIYQSRSVQDFYTRLQNILVPACLLLPSCEGISVCVSRDEAVRVYNKSHQNIFPLGYSVRAPIAHVKARYIKEAVERGEKVPSIRAPRAVRRVSKDWIDSVAGGKKAVTITLRESYIPDRNSNIESWTEFGRQLKKSGHYEPIFIRDTEKIFEDIPLLLEGFTICHEASLNVLFRTALYEESYLNLFINNGPVVLCMLSDKARYLMFKVVTSTNTKTTKHFLSESQGLEYNKSFPGAKPWQKLVWEDDSLDVIQREFEAMCKIIEKI